MSFPTRQFHSLSIDDAMSGNRPACEPSQHTYEDRMEGSGDDSDLEEGDSTEISSVQSKSGLTYDLSKLDADSEARALIGLTTPFDIQSCSGSQTGYDFYFSERPRVHLDANSYTCTCSTFLTQSDVACQHIFWLLDQLHSQFIPSPLASGIPLSSDGYPPKFTRIERLLDGKLEMIADQLNWEYVRPEAEGGMNRHQKVRDIMSAFSATILPEDFRPDLIDDTGSQARTPEQCVVQGDFEATMFRLAVHDDDVYVNLCKVMPPGACAAIYFDKIQEKSRKLLADFDHYCLTGQTAGGSMNRLDVNCVLEQIQYNVERIQWNIIARAPHGMEGAAKSLVTLLEDICSRNKDALDGNRWGRLTFHGEDEDQRNLYQQLIGKTEETGEFFILDTLEYLTGSDLHQFSDKLRASLHKNEVSRAPKEYILKLSALVRAAETESLTTVGRKRGATATSIPGEHTKRTR